MPYSYFPDNRESHWKHKGMYDIDVWLERNTTKCCGEERLVPEDGGKEVERLIGTPFRNGRIGKKSPFLRASKIENKFSGHPAFIFCPGPSIKEVDLGAFAGSLTIAVNSAGFGFSPYLWVMAEAGYVSWFYEQGFCRESVFLWNSRSAFRYICLFDKQKHSGPEGGRENSWGGMANEFKAAFIHTWEEEKTMPPRTSAPSITAALVGAWKLGCDSAYVVGMDLSKPKGETYSKGVPHTASGKKGTFDYQLKALRQFHIPGFTVYNGSPHSQRKDLPFVPVTYKEITDIARSSDSVPKIENFM